MIRESLPSKAAHSSRRMRPLTAVPIFAMLGGTRTCDA